MGRDLQWTCLLLSFMSSGLHGLVAVFLPNATLPNHRPLFQCICTVFLEVTKGEICRQRLDLPDSSLDRASRSQRGSSIATGGFNQKSGTWRIGVGCEGKRLRAALQVERQHPAADLEHQVGEPVAIHIGKRDL